MPWRSKWRFWYWRRNEVKLQYLYQHFLFDFVLCLNCLVSKIWCVIMHLDNRRIPFIVTMPKTRSNGSHCLHRTVHRRFSCKKRSDDEIMSSADMQMMWNPIVSQSSIRIYNFCKGSNSSSVGHTKLYVSIVASSIGSYADNYSDTQLYVCININKDIELKGIPRQPKTACNKFILSEHNCQFNKRIFSI